MNQALLKSRIADVLEGLDYREREIIRLRYGLADGYAYTLEEVGQDFLRHPRAGASDREQGGPGVAASVAGEEAGGFCRASHRPGKRRCREKKCADRLENRRSLLLVLRLNGRQTAAQ